MVIRSKVWIVAKEGLDGLAGLDGAEVIHGDGVFRRQLVVAAHEAHLGAPDVIHVLNLVSGDDQEQGGRQDDHRPPPRLLPREPPR